MKSNFRNTRAFLILSCCLVLAGFSSAMAKTNPSPNPNMPILPYGSIMPLPHAGVQPQKNKIYKALFDVTSEINDPHQLDAGLEHVARAVNVFASAGVSTQHMKFVVILHGPSTFAILNNDEYKKKYGIDNPNIPLIQDLIKAGVHVDVCGQALADFKIEHSWVEKGVQIDLSALATTVIYGDMGYAYMKM